MLWLERVIKYVLLSVGVLGVVVIYGGFFYLLLSGRSTLAIPWYGLLSPWICIFFGLPTYKQKSVVVWFKSKFYRKK